ncbi:hypothetical protein P797_35210 [Pseudomonas aeruginosa VRFPA04]|nr:hypothetical protein P797_35210 [Pseudomonas aeruginosa VRFPA04]
MIDYIRDGQAIYRQSFATIRAEANLAGIPADLEKLAVRVIHACGMVDVVDDLRFSPDALGVPLRFLPQTDPAARLRQALPAAEQGRERARKCGRLLRASLYRGA